MTPTPAPASSPLVVRTGTLRGGERCALGIALNESITEPFDFYNLADGSCGTCTLYFNGGVREGIKAVARNIKGCKAPVSLTVYPDYVFSPDMTGKQVTFYGVAVQAGKIPPVRALSDLKPDTPYVIMMSRETATVLP
jgi:hypothetical protein